MLAGYSLEINSYAEHLITVNTYTLILAIIDVKFIAIVAVNFPSLDIYQGKFCTIYMLCKQLVCNLQSEDKLTIFDAHYLFSSKEILRAATQRHLFVLQQLFFYRAHK